MILYFLQKIKLTHFLINVLFHFHNIAHLESTIVLLISVSGKKEGFKRVYPHLIHVITIQNRIAFLRKKLSFDPFIQHLYLIMVNCCKILNIIAFVKNEWF